MGQEEKGSQGFGCGEAGSGPRMPAIRRGIWRWYCRNLSVAEWVSTLEDV